MQTFAILIDYFVINKYLELNFLALSLIATAKYAYYQIKIKITLYEKYCCPIKNIIIENRPVAV